MVRNRLRVAALLLAHFTNMAAAVAAETDEHLSRNAQKVMAVLSMMGVSSDDAKALVSSVDSHVANNYLNLAQQNMAGGELALRYGLGGGVSSQRLELAYTPRDSHWAVIAKTQGVTVGYHLSFP